MRRLEALPIRFNAFRAEAEHVDKANSFSHLDCRYELLRGYAAKCTGFRILQQRAAVFNHKLITLANDQLDAQIFNTFITTLYMYMFRATSCSSSGGQIVLTQHLVS